MRYYLADSNRSIRFWAQATAAACWSWLVGRWPIRPAGVSVKRPAYTRKKQLMTKRQKLLSTHTHAHTHTHDYIVSCVLHIKTTAFIPFFCSVCETEFWVFPVTDV